MAGAGSGSGVQSSRFLSGTRTARHGHVHVSLNLKMSDLILLFREMRPTFEIPNTKGLRHSTGSFPFDSRCGFLLPWAS